MIFRYVLFLLLCAVLAVSQEPSKNVEEGLGISWLLQQDIETTQIPLAFYSSDTSLALGYLGIFKIKHPELDGRQRYSILSLIGAYTFMGQSFILAPLRLHLDRWHSILDMQVSYRRFPSLFYGIGPETLESSEEEYRLDNIGFSAAFSRQFLFRELYVGPAVDVESFDISDRDSGGQLERGVTGVNGGVLVGMGPQYFWDTRDDDSFPRTGVFQTGSAMFFRNSVGSDYSFNQYRLDHRFYTSINENYVQAFQFILESTNGNAPFHRLPLLGGNSSLRGFTSGRFVDRSMIVAHTEARFPYVFSAWSVPVGMTLYAGIGNVAGRLSDISSGNFKTSLGFGFRIRINESFDSLRIDFAYGSDSESSVSITVRELF